MLQPTETITISTFEPPRLPARPHRSNHHGRTLDDPYFWLRASNWDDVLVDPAALDPVIAAAIAAENRYCEQMLSDTAPLRDSLVAEMRGHMPEAEADVPVGDGPFAYYWRYRPGEEQPVFARVPREAERAAREALKNEEVPKQEQILLDGEKESTRFDYFELGDLEVSPDHRLLAWSADGAGAEKFTLQVRDLKTGRDLPDTREAVSSLTWLDDDHLVIVFLDDHHRASQVRCCRVGTTSASDRAVYNESDPAFEVSVGRMRSGDFIEIVTSRDTQDEVRLIRAGDTSLQQLLVQPREAELEYSIDHYRVADEDRLVILTNADSAMDFTLMSTSLQTPGREYWQGLVEHKAGELLLSVDAYADWLVWTRRVNGLTRVCWMGHDGVEQEWVPAMDAYDLDVELLPEFEQHCVRISVESPTTPASEYELDLRTRELVLLHQVELPSGHDPAHYRTFRIWADSHDQVRVPATCIAHSTTVLDGTAPCVVEVYGSYGSSLAADFSSERLPLLDRGYVYVLAHVRGGQECGRHWYLTARAQHKPNTFHDTVAVADALVDAKIAHAGALCLVGRSAGGLAVGAVLNRWPQRFTSAVADVPFVDVLQTMLDQTLPLTPGESAEWGDPITDVVAYDQIAAYSPYDNVSEQAYPALLVTAGLTDPRVGYWEPLKWVTRLRALSTGDRPLLLHTFTEAGHFGSAGRFQPLSELAREYAFILQIDGNQDLKRQTGAREP